MLIYTILWLILILGVAITWKHEVSPIFWFSAALLTLLLCFRDLTVGADTNAYFRYFLHPENGYGEEYSFGYQSIEPGYRFFNAVLHNLSGSSLFFLASTSLLSIAGTIYFIAKNSNYKLASLLMFYVCGNLYVLNFFVLRQSIATSLYLMGVYVWFTKQNKFVGGMLFVAAMSFHVTSIIAVAATIILSYLHLRKKFCVAVLIVSFLLGALNVLDIAPMFTKFTNIPLIPTDLERFSNYSSMLTEGASGWSIYDRIHKLLPLTLLCIFIYLRSPDEKTKSDLHLKLFWFGVVLFNLIISFPMAARFTAYFLIMATVVTTQYLPRMKKASLLMYVLIFAYFSKTIYGDLAKDSAGVSEYRVAPYHLTREL
jgi:hypothetical protein